MSKTAAKTRRLDEQAGPDLRAPIVMSANSSWNIINFRAGLVRGLIARGHKVVVIAPADEHSEKIEALGARHVPIALSSSGLSVIADGRSLMLYYRLLRAIRPAAYLSFTAKPNIYGALAAHALGIRVINNISGLGTAFMKPGLLQLLVSSLYRLALKRSSTVFFQNQDDRDLFVQRKLVRKSQTKILRGSGIDLDYFTPGPRRDGTERICFLLVARMLSDKGVTEFVGAARMLLEEGYNMHFALLGPADADNRTAIRAEELRALARGGAVDYLGPVNDVRTYMQRADCIVLPSYREGLPRSLIEAAAMAKPVITTDAPGCREVIVPEVTGFLCEARSAMSLAAAMRRFAGLSGPERLAMGAAGRELAVRDYGVRRIIDAYASALVKRLPQPRSALGLDSPIN